MRDIYRLPLKFGLRGSLAVLALSTMLTISMAAQDLNVPSSIEAGHGFSISAPGSGKATFYLVGPDHVAKREVSLGGDLQIADSDVRAAGRYEAILCGSSCTSAAFEVAAAEPAHLSFFLHPSRVPVSSPGSIDATAFVFDPYFNLVLRPANIEFRIDPANGAGFTRQSTTRDGVTWMRMDSTPRQGLVHVTADLRGGPNGAQEKRVIQQVAAEACGLRIKALPSGDKVTLETDPVRDCSGNPLPDGTVVSFTMLEKEGKTTVDAPLKKDVARTQFSVKGPATVSVACGVVLGNEVALNGKL